MGSIAGWVCVGCTRSGGARSGPACFLDAARQVLGPVQKVKGGEVVRTAVVVLPALAGSKENARVVAGRGLARLHIEMIGVQRRFTRYGHYVECKEALLARVNRVRGCATISMRERWGG